jgi:hypothetical protein
MGRNKCTTRNQPLSDCIIYIVYSGIATGIEALRKIQEQGRTVTGKILLFNSMVVLIIHDWCGVVLVSIGRNNPCQDIYQY